MQHDQRKKHLKSTEIDSIYIQVAFGFSRKDNLNTSVASTKIKQSI